MIHDLRRTGGKRRRFYVRIAKNAWNDLDGIKIKPLFFNDSSSAKGGGGQEEEEDGRRGACR